MSDETMEILKRLSLRTGVYAEGARLYLDASPVAKHNVVLELCANIHHESFRKILGKVLTNKILKYCAKHKR